MEPLLRAEPDATEALKISVNNAANACLQSGADPAHALRKAIAQEEYRASTIAENAAYLENRPESSYKKSEKEVKKEGAEKRASQGRE